MVAVPIYFQKTLMKSSISSLVAVLLVAVALSGIQKNLYAVHLQHPTIVVHSEIEGETANDPYRSRFFRVRGTPNITVNSISGDIEVFHNPEIDGVQVDLYVKRSFSLWSGTRSLDDFRIIMHQQGSQIIASVEERRSARRPGRGDVEFHFVVQVSGEASTNLKTVNGDIFLENIDGNHFLQNYNGDLIARNINGEVRAMSSSGNLELEGIKGSTFAKTVAGDIFSFGNSGEIRVRSVSGNIFSERTTGTFISATTSGNIDADFLDVFDGIYAETVSGNITLDVPVGDGYEINSSGMRFDFTGIDQSLISELVQSSRSSSLVIGEGVHPVQLSTFSGTIKISAY